MPTIILSIKLATSPVLIKSYRISFIIVLNIARKLVSPKNITVGLNNSSKVVNTAFIPIFSTISEIRGKE